MQTIVAFIFFVGTCTAQQVKVRIDSLKQVLEQQTDPRDKVETLNEIAVQYSDYKVDSVLTYANKILKLSNEHNYQNGKTQAYKNYGYYYFAMANYEKSLSHFKRALEGFKAAQNHENTAHISNMIAGCYYFQKDFLTSLRYLEDVLDISYEKNLEKYICNGLINIANIYMQLENNEGNLEYLKKAEQTSFCTIEQKALPQNLALAYNDLGQFENALLYAEKLDALTDEKNHQAYVRVLQTKGDIYFKMDSLTKALDFYNRAIALYDDGLVGRKIEHFQTLFSAAEAYYKNKQLDSAEIRAVLSYDLAEETGLKKYAYQNALLLHNIYEEKNLVPQTKKFGNLALRHHADIKADKELKKIYKKLISFEHNLAQIQKENTIKIDGLNTNKNLLTLFVSVMLVTATFLVYINKKLKKTKERTESILREKEQLNHKLQQIESSIASDLHDNFGNRVSGILSLFEVIKDIERNTPRQKGDVAISGFKSLERDLGIFINDINDLLWANKTENARISALANYLRAMATKHEDTKQIKVEFSCSYDKDHTLPKFLNKQLLFSFKELIHGFGTDCMADDPLKVLFSVQEQHLQLTIEGKGNGKAQRTNVPQWPQLQQRLTSLNMSFTVTNQEHQGVRYGISSYL